MIKFGNWAYKTCGNEVWMCPVHRSGISSLQDRGFGILGGNTLNSKGDQFQLIIF